MKLTCSFYSIREGREKEMNICVIYFYEQKILSDRLDEVWISLFHLLLSEKIDDANIDFLLSTLPNENRNSVWILIFSFLLHTTKCFIRILIYVRKHIWVVRYHADCHKIRVSQHPPFFLHFYFYFCRRFELNNISSSLLCLQECV